MTRQTTRLSFDSIRAHPMFLSYNLWFLCPKQVQRRYVHQWVHITIARAARTRKCTGCTLLLCAPTGVHNHTVCLLFKNSCLALLFYWWWRSNGPPIRHNFNCNIVTVQLWVILEFSLSPRRCHLKISWSLTLSACQQVWKTIFLSNVFF